MGGLFVLIAYICVYTCLLCYTWILWSINILNQGPQPGEAAAGSGGVTYAKPDLGSQGTSSDHKVSTDKHRNYAVVAGTITLIGAVGWYLKGTAKKPEVQD